MSQLDFPNGVQGLRLRYLPPIDPIYFVKLHVPHGAEAQLAKQIKGFDAVQFPDGFANDSCEWWPSSFDSAKLSMKAMPNGFYTEYYLVEEGGELILYIKCFTI